MKKLEFRKLAAPVYLFACLILGGSTQTIWFVACLQLIAIAILAWAALEGCLHPPTPSARKLGLLIGAMLVLVLIQFIPLPPLLWTNFPGRALVLEGFVLLNLKIGWQSLSLAPYDTITTVLALLPPLAVLSAILVLRAYTARALVLALFIGTLCNIVLGLIQLSNAHAVGISFYLQPEHNDGTASGFFANANHLATLLLINIPFLVAMVTNALTKNPRQGISKRTDGIVGTSGLALVIVGLATNGSFAGLGLALPVFCLSILITRRFSPFGRGALFTVAALSLATFLLAVLSPVGRQIIPQRHRDSIATRADFNTTGWAVARNYLPMGSGLGTFARVYRIKEDYRLIQPGVFVNHAHNDYLELLIEGGLPAVVLTVLFFLWWAGSILAMRTLGDRQPYALAGAIASAAVLAHSIVDYPLRTSAISASFAASLALLVRARRSGAEAKELRTTRHHTIE